MNERQNCSSKLILFMVCRVKPRW